MREPPQDQSWLEMEHGRNSLPEWEREYLYRQIVREGLMQVVERANAEAEAGAPGKMVAIYVGVEAQHVIADHPGDAQSCDECIATHLKWKRQT